MGRLVSIAAGRYQSDHLTACRKGRQRRGRPRPHLTRHGATGFTPTFNHAPNNQLGDGVDFNDKPFLPYFPYVAPPQNPLRHEHHQEADNDGDDDHHHHGWGRHVDREDATPGDGQEATGPALAKASVSKRAVRYSPTAC